jgi:hypothetical protein
VKSADNPATAADSGLAPAASQLHSAFSLTAALVNDLATPVDPEDQQELAEEAAAMTAARQRKERMPDEAAEIDFLLYEEDAAERWKQKLLQSEADGLLQSEAIANQELAEADAQTALVRHELHQREEQFQQLRQQEQHVRESGVGAAAAALAIAHVANLKNHEQEEECGQQILRLMYVRSVPSRSDAMPEARVLPGKLAGRQTLLQTAAGHKPNAGEQTAGWPGPLQPEAMTSLCNGITQLSNQMHALSASLLQQSKHTSEFERQLGIQAYENRLASQQARCALVDSAAAQIAERAAEASAAKKIASPAMTAELEEECRQIFAATPATPPTYHHFPMMSTTQTFPMPRQDWESKDGLMTRMQ